MSVLGRIGTFFGLSRSAEANPNDERYWSSSGGVFLSSTGLYVTGKQALAVSCVFQSVRLIAETLGSLPLIVYREQDNGGKLREKKHAIATLLRRRPNEWQTSQEFRETLTTHAVLWGQGLAEIITNRTGIEALVPLDPDAVQVEQLGSRGLRFVINEPNGGQRVLAQDSVLRVRGLGVHKFLGSNLLQLAREAIGLWLAQEKFNAHFFLQGANPRLAFEVKTQLSAPAHARLKESIQRNTEGLGNMHKVLIGEEGGTYKALSFSAKDAQMTEARESQVHEIARWFNIPIHLLRAGDQPTFASIEMFNREFVDLTLRPWCVRWEQAIDRDLIVEDDLFAEHLLDGLLRGNTTERFQAYAVAIQNGIMSENEVRLRENLNPYPGLDEPRRSANQDRGADPNEPKPTNETPPPARRRPPQDDDEEDDDQATTPRRLVLIAEAAAARVVRRETSALAREAAKLATKPEAWAAWLEEFYTGHAAVIAESMQLEPSVARSVADRHRQTVLTTGLAALVEANAVAELVNLALEQEAHRAA